MRPIQCLTSLEIVFVAVMRGGDDGGNEGKESSSDSYQPCLSLAISKKLSFISAIGD